MKKITFLLLFVIIFIITSCSKSMSQYDDEISLAEELIQCNPDSALTILKAIDPTELTLDSIKAKYYYVMTSVRDGQNHLAHSDSMINFSNDYYRGKNLKRSIRSTTLLASYNYHMGKKESALRALDSLASLKYVPDSLLIEPLRKRIQMGNYEDNELCIRRLITIDKNPTWQPKYKHQLYFSLLINGKNDSSLVVLDELINSTDPDNEAEKRFLYEFEKIYTLIALTRYTESISLADSLMNKCMDDSAVPYILLWKSLAMLNMHDTKGFAVELAKVDSLALNTSTDERRYINSFTNFLHTVHDYQITGKVNILPFAKINNTLRDNLFNSQRLQQEAIQCSIEIDNQRQILKLRNDRQTNMLIIIVLAALLFIGALLWYAFNNKRKTLETLERNEILQKLVDESKQTDSSMYKTLRRAMLQQLGIIKMVAETPTQQNREMLRKLSSIKSDTNGSLVNWKSIYEMIDNLYHGFYSRLHKRHGDVLTDKEEQIIVLMLAGFSTKEISVITGLTPATIYVRKSSVRKKLGLPEKENIVAFLQQETDG